MQRHHYIYPLLLIASLVVSIFLGGCANRGIGPQGGPKDSIPPVIVSEEPLNGSVNFHGNQIVLVLNEYVQLDQPSKNVFVSPPQLKAPDVKAVGKRVTVTFDPDKGLLDSTTYTVDFGDAICDYNEKNPLRAYSFSFSTGPEIDTLILEGVLIDARTLNPVSGVYVGIQRCLDDSAFARIPFTRVARTDENGRFCIRNIHMGQYRLYALNDFSRDYLYQPGEGIAIFDSLVTPYPAPSPAPQRALPDSLATDSLTIDTLSIDSISTDSILSPFPSGEGRGEASDSLTIDSLLLRESQGGSSGQGETPILRYFVENKQRHYFVRCVREEQHFFTLYFSAPQDSVPLITYLAPQDTITIPQDTISPDTISSPFPLGEGRGEASPDTILPPLPLREGQGGSSARGGSSPFYLTPNLTNDTITCWLMDSAYIRQDTIAFCMTYLASDSLLNLVPQTDTIYATYRPKRLSKKAQEALDKKRSETQFLALSDNLKSPIDVYVDGRLTSRTPLSSFQPDSIHLFAIIDSVSQPLMPHIGLDSASQNTLLIQYDWQPEQSYQLVLDSAALIDIYGTYSKPVKYSFKARSLDEYSTLKLLIEPYDSRAMIEILTDKDVPVRTLPAKEEGTLFEYLAPKDYYVRIYIDENADGQWTTGDWERHRQPEPVYYFSTKLTLRANWDFEETIHYLDTPLLEQKPSTLRKTIDSQKKK